MGLFNWPGKRTEAKLDEITDNVDALVSVKDLEEIATIPTLKLVQKDPYPLYIDMDTNNAYISYDNATLEQVDHQTALKTLNPNEEFSITTNIDATSNIFDAIGTPCHGTFNKNYKPRSIEIEAPVTFAENELEKRLKELESKLAKTVSLVHNCANCGATLNVEENKPVIHCKYCGSTYIVGTARIYSNY